jgi:ATP-dependent DNA helicase RecQ
MTTANPHPILSGLDDEAFLVRRPTPPSINTAECRNHYFTLDPSQVDLSFAGRLQENHPSLHAIRDVDVDDPVQLSQREGRWFLLNANGSTIGRLARKFTPPPNAKFLYGRVHAVTTRFREDNSAEYQDQLRRDQWNVVLPELVFTPDNNQRSSSTKFSRSDCRKDMPSRSIDDPQVILNEAVQTSQSWSELQAKLKHQDLELAPKGGGLVLRSLSDSGWSQKASAMGHPYSRLIKRFGCGFPGHPQVQLVERILGQRQTQSS